jgi:murein DD-endopeptidase MepM/ murein hydrolase activator NlpD
LDHGRLRGAQRPRVAHEPIDLGNEPPLSVDGDTGSVIDRRHVSIQWFSGTILTGLCGAALMGGAVFASLDGETNFASMPERFEGMLRNALGGSERVTARKGDRLPTYTEPSAARQVIRVSTTTRVGNRELVRVRPFVRVAGNLSLSVSELSAHIPPFNPQRMLAESGADAAPSAATAAAAPDAEVSFVTRDLGTVLPQAHLAAVLPVDKVLAQVRENSSWAGSTGRPGVPGLAGTRLAYAAEGNVDPYAGFEARIVPENITLLPKTAQETTGGNPWNEKVVTAKKGDTVASMLQELGATPDEGKAIADLLGPSGKPGGLKEGQKLRVLLSPVEGNRRMKPVRVIVAGEDSVEAAAAFSDVGKYVAVDVQTANNDMPQSKEEEHDDGTGVRLYQSIYETALRDQIPRPVIDDLVRIYSYDVDYQRKVQPGDSFEVMYAGDDEAAGSKAEVMFAELTVGGETKKFYRFQTPDDGVVDYYDENGRSAKKFLVRKPVSEGIMRSPFGFRRHPILGFAKMHTGVDWAAHYGSPIFAAGNGVVEKAGWESGYGKYVRIKHNNGYETAYGHMTAFAVGIEEGTHVRQGQVIGFVGSTGMSTGAHVHYEILINGRFVDPMKIKLPRGRSLQGPILASFTQERDRLDAMMTRAPMRTAQSTR